MRIAIGSDHSGFELKRFLKAELAERGLEFVDFGAHDTASVDYPDIVIPLARAVAGGDADLGVVMCSNGVGVSIVANKIPGIRAALCADAGSARRARQHADANVLALGALAIGTHLALEILDTFLQGEFEAGGRHERRVNTINVLDAVRARD